MKLLGEETQSKIRSTLILTSLPQLVSELVQNALDAEATQVEVGMDPEEWTCWVRDDGTGMSKDGMAIVAEGFQGGRYGTSKAYTPASLDQVSTFGFRGEALASAADLTCLEISSRTRKSHESWSIILKGGKCLYSGPSLRWNRNSSGTVVSIRDAFYNLPIRRLSHPSPSKTFELVSKDLATLSLVFPAVSFSLEDTRKTREGQMDRPRVLSIPKAPSSIAAFRHCFGRALAEHVDEIFVALDGMQIEGFIGLEGALSKAHQYLYINRHPLARCDLHSAIDLHFNASSFSKNAYEETGETDLPRSSHRRSPRKAEKKPIYVLNLTVPPAQVDNILEPAKAIVNLKNHDSVVSFLSSVVKSFLVRHGFLQSRILVSHTNHSSSPSPRKRRRKNSDPQEHPPRNDITVPNATGSENISLYINQDENTCKEVTWTDPKTNETFIVDTRTGNSYPRAKATPTQQGEYSLAPPSRRRRRILVDRYASESEPETPFVGGRESPRDMPDWIRKALDANHAYASTERSIREAAHGSVSTLQRGHICHTTPEGAEGLSVRFSKEDIRHARVVNQVDNKFIACIIESTDDASEEDPSPSLRAGIPFQPRGHTGTLVLIDQHAADERVRVERFLREVCTGFMCHGKGHGVGVVELGPPKSVLLTVYEARRLRGSAETREAFARWGIMFGDLSEEDIVGVDYEEPRPSYVQVEVRTVPEVVADKLLSGDELRDLVKGFLATLEAQGMTLTLPSLPPVEREQLLENEQIWQKALRWCPRELVNLINSKACRGAIMFNDRLSIEQCKRLVHQLSETSLPFQCAHGRPSMAPLTSIPSRRQGSQQVTRPVNWASFDGQWVSGSPGNRVHSMDSVD